MNRLPRDAAELLFLELFKSCVSTKIQSLVAGLGRSGKLMVRFDDLEGLFQSKQFYNSVSQQQNL